MKTRSHTIALVAASLLVPLSVGLGPSSATASSGITHRNVPVCAAPVAGAASCDAIVNEALLPDGRIAPGVVPSGYGPVDLQSAYALATASAGNGSGKTVAIVDAYNDPYVRADLCMYRTQWKLTPLVGCNSATAGMTLTVVNQSGGTKLPKNNGGWAEEISLDVDMVSAICPNCNILLVEASTSSLTNLGAAVNTAAAAPGVTAISNSYGGSESSADLSYDSSYYNHPGIAITASSGDSGYGASYPAASQYVTSVGGTTLTRSAATRGWSETAWSKAGSGCSSYDPQPTWQSSLTNISGVCSKRAIADVSAVADPNTGVAVYDSYSYQGLSGWLVFGGTSVSSPIIASVYALAGNASSVSYASSPYGHTSSLNDVVSGSNGTCGNLLCNAADGWDGPTGLGTPLGIGAF